MINIIVGSVIKESSSILGKASVQAGSKALDDFLEGKETEEILRDFASGSVAGTSQGIAEKLGLQEELDDFLDQE